MENANGGVKVLDIATRLATLRDSPVNNQGCSDEILVTIHGSLMSVPADSSDGVYHWFCQRASSVTIDAATFLLRLFAYTSPLVDLWKTRLQTCLYGCAPCVQGFEEAKLSSRTTFFGAFDEPLLDNFYKGMDEWQVSSLIKSLNGLGFSAASSGSTGKSLSDVPPGLFYQILSNLSVLLDVQIHSILHKFPPTQPLASQLVNPPPAGLLMLLMDVDPNIRDWSHSQCSKCTVIPIMTDKFQKPHRRTVELIASTLCPSKSGTIDLTLSPPVTIGQESAGPFTLPANKLDQWMGFSRYLRLIPPHFLTTTLHQHADLRRIIIGHLHDSSLEFPEILKCFLLILKRLGMDVWAGEGSEYPLVVFDSVKDNPAFLSKLADPNLCQDAWLLGWFSEYLHTVPNITTYGALLAKIFDFMCEELQHERFQDTRPTILVTANRLLSGALEKAIEESKKGNSNKRLLAVLNVLDIHAESSVNVAFSRAYSERKWIDARRTSRDLIVTALEYDIHQLSSAIRRLCKALAHPGQSLEPKPLKIRQHWSRMYEVLQSTDIPGTAMVISLAAHSSHLDVLNARSFSPLIPNPSSPGGVLIREFNASLDNLHHKFPDILRKFTDYNNSSSVLDLLRRPNVAKDITVLMLSPVESIQIAAQTLLGSAFDVDGRQDCFRALLENLPDSATEGLFEFLDIFIIHAQIVPEACSLAKSLVRCFTDILEVLCTSHGGLLHNPHFIQQPETSRLISDLPRLWHMMTEAISIIFKRTPLWSTYFDNEDMIVWMRDALIFGRDLLAQQKVIETAANLRSEQTRILAPKKLSEIGKKMIGDLQGLLPELTRWLRLTDVELLHQSFSLLKSLLESLREAGVPPHETGLTALTKYINDARKKDVSRSRTRLDHTKISELQSLIQDDDDCIEIIGHIPPRTAGLKAGSTSAGPKQQLSLKQALKAQFKGTPSSSMKQFTSRSSAGEEPQIDQASTIPAFRKKGPSPSAEPSRTSAVSSTRPNISPKNEGSSKSSPQTEDSSSGESDSEEEDECKANGLAALGKMQRSPKIKRPIERRQVKVFEVPGQKVNPMQDRISRRDDARRTALRLKPDISGLHRTILSWNYNHTGSEPPSFTPQLLKVPETFTDHSHYLRIYEPLLFLECWAQICKAKEEPQEAYDSKIVARQFTDDWLDLDITITGNVRKDWYLTETDVVLLRSMDGQKNVMSKVQGYRATPNAIQVNARCIVSGPDPGLHINTNWRISKIFSLSTLHREYAALRALPYYDLYNDILQPRLPKPMVPIAQAVERTMKTYDVNKPQAIAIISSLNATGFSLIQGPPGTGKTSTICGLISAVLANRSRPLNINSGQKATSSIETTSQKILVCAPSNAAIDEVAYRLKNGIRGPIQQSGSFKVVRVGQDAKIGTSVRDIALDTLVDQKLSASQVQPKDLGNEISSLRTELNQVRNLKQQKLEELSNLHDNMARTLALQQEIRQLNSRRLTLTQQFDKLKDQQKSDIRTVDATRRKYRTEILQEADIICSTLSGSGHDGVEQFDYEMIIIDEAAQAVELSALIPLRYKCKACILVGDPQQLPPTVLSKEASKLYYDQSLFVRIQRQCPDAVHLLSIQYRMHPDISQLPSRLFYEGRLLDGRDMELKTRQPWHEHERFGTYRFFNISSGVEQSVGRSQMNRVECQVAVALYARLRREFRSVCLDFKVGVISMYKAQLLELRRQFEERLGKDVAGKVDFNTVDGFQGQEKDIIILSCVRAGPGLQSVGFLSDSRRMNVAFTRARSSLFILGNAATLERSDETWRSIISDARTRSYLVDADSTYFTSPSIPRLTHPKKAVQAPPPEIIPHDLFTPQQLKEAKDYPHPPVPPVDGRRPEVDDKQQTLPSVPDNENHRTGLKRPADEDLPSHVLNKPRPPLAKKPKQPTLFIPKSHNEKVRKRAENIDGLEVPSHQKRRVS